MDVLSSRILLCPSGLDRSHRFYRDVLGLAVYSSRSPDTRPLDAANVRRAFKKVTNSAGLGDNWKPLELRTSFVSLMSGSGVPVEKIARLVGHTSTRITEVVYRRELRPVITTGAEVMDKIFSG